MKSVQKYLEKNKMWLSSKLQPNTQKKKIKKIQPIHVHENKTVLTYLNSCSHLDYHYYYRQRFNEVPSGHHQVYTILGWYEIFAFFTVLKSELIEQIKIWHFHISKNVHKMVLNERKTDNVTERLIKKRQENWIKTRNLGFK